MRSGDKCSGIPHWVRVRPFVPIYLESSNAPRRIVAFVGQAVGVVGHLGGVEFDVVDGGFQGVDVTIPAGLERVQDLEVLKGVSGHGGVEDLNRVRIGSVSELLSVRKNRSS